MGFRKIRVGELSESILERVRAESQDVTFIDVGARGGVTGLSRIAKSVRALGIEPNPNEKFLIESNHYAQDPRGFWTTPNYKKLDYFWGAIAPSQQTHTKLYVTQHPGASGVYQPNQSALNFKYKINMPHKITSSNGFGDLFETVQEIQVPTLRLKDLMLKFDMDHIDYLKIDVEGFEAEVLESLEENLTNVTLIKVEVCFLPFRKNQKMFDTVFKNLTESGFEFLIFDGIQKGYKSNFSSKYWNAKHGFKDVHATWMSADAFFWKIPEAPNHKLRGSVVLLHEGFIDQAVQCLASDKFFRVEDTSILKYWGIKNSVYTLLKFFLSRYKSLSFVIRWYNYLRSVK
jgi:FkbM family methyltransferase